MACFLHFLPNGEYMITQDEYWEETELSLCIKEEDEYIVLAYDNAKIIRVPVSQIIDKKERVKYKRNKNKVVFACPVKRSELIYTEVKGPNDNNYMRLDDIFPEFDAKLCALIFGELTDKYPSYQELIRKIDDQPKTNNNYFNQPSEDVLEENEEHLSNYQITCIFRSIPVHFPAVY